MKFHSFDEFKQVRLKAAQWRTYEKQLDTLGDLEREVVREVLLVDTIDNRTDRDYEKRLYDGYKNAIDRLSRGQPLIDEETKGEDPEEERRRERERQFEEGVRFMGLIPKTPSPPRANTPSPPRTPDYDDSYSPYSPPSTPYLTPSPVNRELFATPSPASSVSSQGTEILPPTPKPFVSKEAKRLGISTKKRKKPVVGEGKKVGRPKKGEVRPPKPSRPKRQPQKKFDPEVLKAVRPNPPRTRGSHNI